MSSVESTSVRANDYLSRLEADDEDGSEFIDHWDTGELLCLASAVQRSGDKNWVSVSRSIKPFGEQTRPSDWYTPKNCALQYSKLLKGVEDFKKKALPRTERETSEEMLVKNLTDKRLNELMRLNQQTRATANVLKIYLEMVENGDFDEHVDDLLKQIEELEKREEEDFSEYLSKRENLNSAKKLNKCRITLNKGKAPLRSIELKRKNSPNPDMCEDASSQLPTQDIVIKTEIDTDEEYGTSSRTAHMKVEDNSSTVSVLLDNSKGTNITSLSNPSTPTSPLLTSLLRNVSSTNPCSQNTLSVCSSPLKECDFADTPENAKSGLLSEIEIGGLTKSRETSPRSSVPQSPRPTPASSPLLNSLLKNSPSNTSTFSSLQIQQPKEATTPKAVSSPQSFFNPTSALATAAAQQLAVATATLPQAHQFFHHDSAENRKHSIQISPVTSACLSAPTLSKLLEMPPSTPGRLPPLPVVEAPVISVPSVSTSPSDNVPKESVPKSSTLQMHDVELSVTHSPSKKLNDKIGCDKTTAPESFIAPKDCVSESQEKSIPASKSNEKNSKSSNQKSSYKHTSLDIENTSQENLDILEEVHESINQVFEKKEIRTEAMDIDDFQCSVDVIQESQQIMNPDVKNNLIKIENLSPEDDVSNVSSQSEKKLPGSDSKIEEKIVLSPNVMECVDTLTCESEQAKNDTDSLTTSIVPSVVSESISAEKVDITAEEDRGISSRKFYKSRVTSKKRISMEEDLSEKTYDGTPIVKQPSKKIRTKLDFEVSPQHFVSDSVVEIPAKQLEELSGAKDQETKLSTKAAETKSPVSKKPRIFEKTPSKEKEYSEDEVPLAKRTGRREYFAARKGRGKVPKLIPTKQEEPKDQYEFSESTEENSVGYQTTNTLCYMPRVKDDSRFEESKTKSAMVQDSDEKKLSSNMGSPTGEKKYLHTPLKSKQVRTSLGSTASRKNLFGSDEERMSDSLTSDEASNSVFGDDKLKKWKDSSEKDDSKDINESKTVSRPPKVNDSVKKKSQLTKKCSLKNDTPIKKEKKLTNSDLEELSRDSEDVSTLSTWQRKEGDAKEKNRSTSGDMDIETTDSHLSSSVAAESDKQIDDIEGFESLQGSVTTEFSPLPPSEMKEEKDISQFGKQDWYHGSSPKSSEAVSQSSEESEEYESDNWDNQSVSTNKSASHSASQQPRLKRKERESPQYKAWKKAISIVLREASCHKYANVFLQKVTNDVAPGYLSIVYRPMDLSLIKKNIDNGIVKTTDEFHRDMMLMFQNAIMYNSSDHDVHHMAVEMQRDVIQQIQAFLTTQSNDKDENGEPASSLRGGRTTKSQKTYSSISKSRDEADRNE